MHRAVFLLAVLGVATTLGCPEHSRQFARKRGAGRRDADDDRFLDEGREEHSWRDEYDRSDSQQEENIDEETAESSHQAAYRDAQPQISSRTYGVTSHKHHGGYGKHEGSLTLKPVEITLVCSVMDPLEHIVWLQARCPDEYDRGHVIAKGSTSLSSDLFGVSVSGEDGTFTSTLTIIDPVAKGAGGVFRCEAWPHPGYGRHKRELTPSMLGETPVQASERQGRAHQDPWNAIILGGSELIEECFYGGYEDKWRKLRALNTEPSSRNAPISSRRLSDEEDHQSGPVKFIPRSPVEYDMTQGSLPFVPTEPTFYDKTKGPLHVQDHQRGPVKFIPRSPVEYDMTQGTLPFVPTEPTYTPTEPTYHASPVTPMPVPEVQQQLNEEDKSKNSQHPSNSQDEVLLSELHDPEVRLQFLRSLSPEQLHGLRQSMLQEGSNHEERLHGSMLQGSEGESSHEPQKLVVLTNMQPFQRLNGARLNEARLNDESLPQQRSTPTVRAPKSGLEVRTNMVPLHRFANSRMIQFSPDNATQSS